MDSPEDARSYHMSSRELRERGHEIVDWIADYWERVESLPVLLKA